MLALLHWSAAQYGYRLSSHPKSYTPPSGPHCTLPLSTAPYTNSHAPHCTLPLSTVPYTNSHAPHCTLPLSTAPHTTQRPTSQPHPVSQPPNLTPWPRALPSRPFPLLLYVHSLSHHHHPVARPGSFPTAPAPPSGTISLTAT